MGVRYGVMGDTGLGAVDAAERARTITPRIGGRPKEGRRLRYGPSDRRVGAGTKATMRRLRQFMC